MMKRLLGALALVLACPALAQSTATPTLPGYLSSSNHSCGQTACWVGYGSSIPVTPGAPAGATSTDISGTVTLGGTYQTVLAASATRKGCLIQNPTTATEILSIKVGTMASPFTVAAGSTFSCGGNGVVVTDAITLTAATTTHAFAGVSQ